MNKFEQIDAPPHDALTLILKREADAVSGQTFCPVTATGGRLPKDFRSAEMPPREAFRAAVKFANDFKVPMVVLDPDGLWQAEWGTLYREEGSEDEGSPAQ